MRSAFEPHAPCSRSRCSNSIAAIVEPPRAPTPARGMAASVTEPPPTSRSPSAAIRRRTPRTPPPASSTASDSSSTGRRAPTPAREPVRSASTTDPTASRPTRSKPTDTERAAHPRARGTRHTRREAPGTRGTRQRATCPASQPTRDPRGTARPAWHGATRVARRDLRGAASRPSAPRSRHHARREARRYRTPAGRSPGCTRPCFSQRTARSLVSGGRTGGSPSGSLRWATQPENHCADE